MAIRLLSGASLGVLGLGFGLGCGSPSGGGGGSGGSGAAGGNTITTTTSAGGSATTGAGAAGGGGAVGTSSTDDTTTGAAGSGGTGTTTETCTTTADCAAECTAAELAFGDASFTLYAPDNSLFDGFGTMTLTAVSEAGFELEAVTGDTVQFGWAGPDPTPYFQVGDVVEANKEVYPGGNGWSWIAGNGMVAGSWSSAEWGTVISTPMPAPFGGPAFYPQYLCHETGPSCLTHVYSLNALLEGESVIAGVQEIGEIGAYRFYNPGVHVIDCDGEDSTVVGITVLGPMAPP